MNYYTVCPDCGYKLLKAGFGSKHATKATGKEQVPPVAFCVKPHASPCASLRRIGHRNSDASLHSAIPSLRSLQIPLSAPTLQARLEANQNGSLAQVFVKILRRCRSKRSGVCLRWKYSYDNINHMEDNMKNKSVIVATLLLIVVLAIVFTGCGETADLTEISKKIEEMQGKIEGLEQENDGLGSQVSELQSDVESLGERVKKLESSVNLINTLDKRISALEAAGGDATQFEQLKIQVQNLQADLIANKASDDAIKAQATQMQLKLDEIYAAVGEDNTLGEVLNTIQSDIYGSLNEHIYTARIIRMEGFDPTKTGAQYVTIYTEPIEGYNILTNFDNMLRAFSDNKITFEGYCISGWIDINAQLTGAQAKSVSAASSAAVDEYSGGEAQEFAVGSELLTSSQLFPSKQYQVQLTYADGTQKTIFIDAEADEFTFSDLSKVAYSQNRPTGYVQGTRKTWRAASPGDTDMILNPPPRQLYLENTGSVARGTSVNA